MGKTEDGRPRGTVRLLYDIEKGEGKYRYHVQAFLLDGFIIQAAWKKVNGEKASFTICLQPLQIKGFSFIKRSNIIGRLAIDIGRVPC